MPHYAPTSLTSGMPTSLTSGMPTSLTSGMPTGLIGFTACLALDIAEAAA